MMVAVL